MLHKGAIVWAAGIGAVVAIAAGGAFWRYSHLAPDLDAPTQSTSRTPAASGQPPSIVAVTPDRPEAAQVPIAAGASPSGATPAPASSKPPGSSPQSDVSPPQFDIVRIEPTGEAVIAGHAAPKAKVTITDRNQVVAEAEADESGQFVILPPPFAPGAHTLGLVARIGDGAPVQAPGLVGIDVPQPAVKPIPVPPVAVATAAPSAKLGAPAPPISAASPVKGGAPAGGSSPMQAARPPGVAAQVAKIPVPPVAVAPAPAKPAASIVIAKSDASSAVAGSTPRIVISGVAADEAGRMVATGSAPAGAFLRLYLNGSLLADVTARADGFWSLTVERGMRGGAYSIRADEIDRIKDSVISRAEVPFNFPEHLAELAPVAKRSTSSVAPTSPPAPAPAPLPVASSSPTAAVAPVARPEAVAPAVAPKDKVAAVPSASGPPTSAPSAPNVPAQNQALAHSPAPAKPSMSPDAGRAIVSVVDTARVVPGDSLWAISAHLYGNGLRYTQIYAANSAQIRNPSLIYPGQIFVLPQPAPY
jgi:nucleoid-associated protein YgaU